MEAHELAIWINGVGFGMALLVVIEKVAIPLALHAARHTRSRRFRY